MAIERPPRVLGGHHTEFWDRCTDAGFSLQRCGGCEEVLWPPSSRCDRCLGAELEWEEVSGAASLVTHCEFEREYYPQCPPPWLVILVRLAEGPLFVSNPQGIGRTGLVPGLPLKVVMLDCEDVHGRFRLPVFGPVSGAHPELPSKIVNKCCNFR
ncbi:MAG TPA: zinc ribbon domain-containing protein [Solirubrobacterales bacterium]|nr:zinc ribbon domain-containing protein [Solirubrobacterales bacterium]